MGDILSIPSSENWNKKYISMLTKYDGKPVSEGARKTIKELWDLHQRVHNENKRLSKQKKNHKKKIIEIHNLLLENISVSENRKTGEKSPTVRFIDFKEPNKNSFIAISQFKVNIPGTEKHIIPDIVLFVNGLPLVVIECKSPSISEPIQEAITQLKRYSNRRGVKEGNEKLFWYNILTIATSNQVAKHGTLMRRKDGAHVLIKRI